MQKYKNPRELQILEFVSISSRTKKKSRVPRLIISGVWFQNLGFEPGEKVLITPGAEGSLNIAKI